MIDDPVRRHLRKVWTDIRERCENPNAVRFARYGGRGIKLCRRWQDFRNFLADMAPTYEDGLTIDRIDNDGDYEPSNCQWATAKDQSRNRSNTVFVMWKGEERKLAELAEEFGLTPATVRNRIALHGWSVEKALLTPVRKGRPRRPVGGRRR